MMQKQSGPCFFKSVEPLENHRLLIHTIQGEEILFDFTPRLAKTRFADLKNEDLFYSAATDGANIIFKIHGSMPLILSVGEYFDLLKNTPIKPACGERRGAL